MTDEQRAQEVADVLHEAFTELSAADPVAFRRRYRAMAADPFAFYRGSACLGQSTWDLLRLAASVALRGWTTPTTRGRCGSTRRRGAVLEALRDAQAGTRMELLERSTEVVDGERAYAAYLDTVPGSKRMGSISYTLEDVVGRTGSGIGSAGLPAYAVLVEGHTQALENDVVLVLKQGAVPSAARVAGDARVDDAFSHQGERTAVSRRALQAQADPWGGWTWMEGGGPHDGVGFVVAELSPYEADLDRSSLTEADEMSEVLAQLGRATAKVHCVSDADDESTPLVDVQTEDAVLAVVAGREEELVADVVAFAHSYAQVRADHALFVEAFRSGRLVLPLNGAYEPIHGR